MRLAERFISFSQRSCKIPYLSYDIKITLKSHFWHKNVKICHYVSNIDMDDIAFPENL